MVLLIATIWMRKSMEPPNRKLVSMKVVSTVACLIMVINMELIKNHSTMAMKKRND